jgi:hypothetical protein
MDRKQATKVLSIVQAIADGKEVQCRNTAMNGNWRAPVPADSLEFPEYEWRIKPEVKEGWINIYSGRFKDRSGSYIYPSKEEANKNSEGSNEYIACIKISYTDGEGL